MKITNHLLTPILALTLSLQPLTAQDETPDSIRINPQFLHELDDAFAIQKPEHSLQGSAIHPETLTKDLLHEWVGKYDSSIPHVHIAGLSPEDLTKDAYLWKRGQWGILRHSGAITGIDVNSLGKYIRPEEIHIRQMREIAAKSRKVMDKWYPMEGAALYTIQDSLELSSGIINK